MHDRRTTILNIPVDLCSRLEFRMFLNRACASGRAHRVVTLNPEIILTAMECPRYASTIRTADCCTVDGVGLALALRILRRARPERITGIHVLEDMCATAAEEGRAIAILLRSDGLTAPPLLRAALHERWPDLRVAVATVQPSTETDSALRSALRDHTPEFLIVNFGHPIQEEWIARHIDEFPSIRVAVGIGGAVDYFTGAAAKPPESFARLGFEWAWRLFRQPRRWRRILRATIVFPYRVIRGIFTERLRTPRTWWHPRLWAR